MPGADATVCVDDVLPLPHKNAIGAMPPVEEADHVIAAVDGVPAHEVVNADAVPVMAIENTNAALAMETADLFKVIEFIMMRYCFL